MNIKQAIEVLIKAASTREYSELEKMIVDEALLICSQLQYENDEKESSKEEIPEEKAEDIG